MAVCKDRDAKAELNRRSQTCEALTGTGVRIAETLERRSPNRRVDIPEDLVQPNRSSALRKVDGHKSNALSISVWKTDVCLSTPMPKEAARRAEA